MLHPIYIINYNRHRSLVDMVDYLAGLDAELAITIIDNDSLYKPTQALYRFINHWCGWSYKPQIRVINKGNHGPYGPWHNGIINHETHFAEFGVNHYFVTDSDLDLSGCPRDVLDYLADILTFTHQHCHEKPVKVGLSLEINDLPTTFPDHQTVKNWESQYWRDTYTDYKQQTLYWSGVDTTFACYTIHQSVGRAMSQCPALRTNRPYTARHLPWYITPENITEEDKFFINQSAPQFSHWTKLARGYEFVRN